MPKISVLVPVYNVERYLSTCLDSLINQTMNDIEIIAIDDGSTDTSGKILDEYANKDIRIKVFHKVNTGYGNTMNVALSQATGEYVGILESDDFIVREAFEKLYKAAIEQQADVVKANYYNFYEDRAEFRDSLQDYPMEVSINAVMVPQIINKAETIWSGIYRRSFLEQQKIYFHETPGAAFQDISFAIQVWVKAKRIYLLPDAFVYYRRDNGDSSMHNPRRIMNVFDEYEWLEEILKEEWKHFPVLEQNFVATKYGDYLNHYYRVAAPYQYALLLKMANSFATDFHAGRIKKAVFRPDVWDKISRMHEDLYAFFLSSAKELHDPRFELCEFQNENLYVDGWITGLTKYPQLIIYGAGKVGQWLHERLRVRGIPVTCFAVTQKDESTDRCGGIPVQELRDIQQYAASGAVVIAVTESLQYELYKNLVKYGFKHVYRLDQMLRKQL